MSDRIEAELELIKGRFPNLEYRETDNWARIRDYPLPDGWQVESAEVAFKMPVGLPGEQPYGFWVRPPLRLPSDAAPTNTSGPVATGFGDGWQQFSWSPELWRPGANPRSGTNMLDFVRSIRQRLEEIN